MGTSVDQEVLYCIVDCYWLSAASILEDNDAKQFFFVFMWYGYEVLGRSKHIYSIQSLLKIIFIPKAYFCMIISRRTLKPKLLIFFYRRQEKKVWCKQ